MIRPLEIRALCCPHHEHAPLCELSLTFCPASLHLLIGSEHCGKNLLLRVLGLLERPQSGEVLLHGQPTAELAESAREELRNRQFGYLFSAPFLLPSLTVLENVAMPLFRISHLDPAQAHERMDELLEFVGLGGRAQEPIDGLSAFDQQRVALARGLANRPSVLLIENLDSALAGNELHDFGKLLRLASAAWNTTVIATASGSLGHPTDRVIELAAGPARHDSLQADQA